MRRGILGGNCLGRIEVISPEFLNETLGTMIG